ncbi:MAG: hypothetical protein IH606_21525, partial [Burkholderiales bacterium]|nr:hypothetical protein [Burkholderiales bacterium]
DVTNDFVGALSASGADITLTDANDLTVSIAASGLGDLNAVAGVLTVTGSTGTTLTTDSGTDTSFGPGPTSVGTDLTTTAGASVSQTGTLTVAGTSSLTAVGAITLADVTNDFVGALSASGTDITLADANSLTASIAASGLGDLNAVAGVLTVEGSTGTTLTTHSGTDTVFGLTSVGTDLTTTAGASVSQTGALAVGGTSSLTALGAITLADVTNDFVGALSASGTDITLIDANSLAVGTVSTPGLTAQGDITLKALGAGDITVSNNIQKAGAGAQTLILQANRNIIFSSGADVGVSGSNAFNVVLNSDLDQATFAGGAIQLNSGTVINSNGGNITLGGGADPLTTAAIGSGALVEGVKLDNAQIASGAGAINVRGVGLSGSANAHGVGLTNSSSATSTSGSVTMVGAGGAGSGSSRGIYLNNGASAGSASGVITLTGVGSSDVGVEVANSSITSTGAAIIQVTGTGAAGSNDLRVASGTNSIGGTSAAGDILLNGTSNSGMVLGAGGDSTTLRTTGNITLNQTGGGISQGSGSLLANGLRLIGSGAFSLNQASNNINVLVADLTGAATSLFYRDADGFSIGTGAGGLSTVKTAGGGTTTTNGITVGTVGTATNTLALNAYGAVTQTTSDNVIAGGLQLLGYGPYTLTNAGNDVTTLAAKVAGNISYRDGSGLSVGTVTDAPSSTSTTGIATTSGPGGTGTLILTNAGTLNVDAPINAAGGFIQNGAGTTILDADIVTDISLVQFTQHVLVSGGPRLIDTTHAPAVGTSGTIQFLSTLDGGGNSLTFNARNGPPVTGNISIAGAATNIANFTLSGKDIDLAGVTATGFMNMTATGTATLAGPVTAGGSFTATTNVLDLTGSISAGTTVVASATGNMTIAGNVSGPSGVTLTAGNFSNSAAIKAAIGAIGITSGGSFLNSGAIGGNGGVTVNVGGALTSSGTITAGAGAGVMATSVGDMTISDNVTGPSGVTLNVTGADRMLTQNGGTIGTADSPIALVADEMILTSAINSGGGAVTLKPNSTADAIQLGVAAASTDNSAAMLELSDGELNTVATTGGLTVGASNHAGAITVVGALAPTSAQNGFILLNNTGGIAINAPIVYAAGNGNLTLTASGGGAAAGAITTSGAALDVNGTLALNAATGVGTLAAPMVLTHGAGTTLSVANSTSGGVFARADVGDLNIVSIDNSAAAGGGINLNVGTNLNINGTVQNTQGDILFVTGNDAAYAGAGGFGLSPASVAVGTLGALNIKGRVIAKNAGAISIFSTGAVTQSADLAAGLQSAPAGGTAEQGALKVRTFNDGAGVGVIRLQNNLADTGNSMGPITMEARLAGSINPPPYAESNIDYKSINGTNISGIGTAADFSLVAPSQTIDLAPGASLSGTNVNLIATAGDVTLKSAITNAQINGGRSGGSLNLYATGNIILDNPGGDSAGVVIGKDLGTLDALGGRQFEKFDHTLTLVATNDVRIHGTVQVAGDLALRANASAGEASGPGGIAGYGAGSGSVIIAGSAGNPVEVRASNIVVGVKDASGNALPVRNLIIDNSANSSGTGMFLDSTLRADKKLDIYLNGDQGGAGTSGNIFITGGSAAAASAGPANPAGKSSALAVISGEVITVLGVKGGTQQPVQDPDTQTVNPSLPYTSNSSSITLQGGTATSSTAAGGGALAAADALILGTVSKFIDIGGNIELMGGTANSLDGGQTSAGAKIDPPNLTINVGGYIKLAGGVGPGAPAAIVNSGDMVINIGGKFDHSYTDAAGTHTVKDVGLLLLGGAGSGLFDRDNQEITLYYDVSSQVLIRFPAINGGAGGGNYFQLTDATRATAFIQSLSPRGFDDSLMSYIIFAANEETRAGRINTGLSNVDDSNKPSCN